MTRDAVACDKLMQTASTVICVVLDAYNTHCQTIPRHRCEATALGWTPSVTPDGREIDIHELENKGQIIPMFDGLYRDMIKYATHFGS